MAITLNGTTGITTPADTVTGNATVGGTLTVNGVSNALGVPSTAGNVLTSNGTAWVSSAPTAASLTLLATLTTTSGTTQTVTSLPTTYTNLILVFEGVGNSTGSDSLNVAASSNNGSSYGSVARASSFAPTYGFQQITRANSSSINHPITYAIASNYFLASQNAFIPVTSAGAINALQFSWASGYTFNAGAIYIYGWN